MNTNNKRIFDLNDRLIQFTLAIADLVETIPKTHFGLYLSNQLIRSAAAPVLNYAEAEVSESRNDFIHKMKICLKELNESYASLSIISKSEK